MKKYHNFSSENIVFYSRENLQYIVWACFPNVIQLVELKMYMGILTRSDKNRAVQPQKMARDLNFFLFKK